MKMGAMFAAMLASQTDRVAMSFKRTTEHNYEPVTATKRSNNLLHKQHGHREMERRSRQIAEGRLTHCNGLYEPEVGGTITGRWTNADHTKGYARGR